MRMRKMRKRIEDDEEDENEEDGTRAAVCAVYPIPARRSLANSDSEEEDDNEDEVKTEEFVHGIGQ